MFRRMYMLALLLALLLNVLPASATPRSTLPPGFNIHRVLRRKGHVFWRGGTPRLDTLKAVLARARARGVTVTFIDLRHPANADDRSGRGGRLTPHSEKRASLEAGAHYLSISALDHALIPDIDRALARGDVYIHCMYGVNRTGFAIGRFAVAEHLQVGRVGIGKRDYHEGVAFEKRLEGVHP